MSDDPKAALALEAAKKIGQESTALLKPVGDVLEHTYNDALHSPLSETGGLVGDLIRTFRQPVRWSAEKLSRFVDRSLSRVPFENRIKPHAALIGPIVEGVRYYEDGEPLHEMFSRLLSCACDKDKVGLAHPSFPQIIAQLSSDEAQIIQNSYKNNGTTIHMTRFWTEPNNNINTSMEPWNTNEQTKKLVEIEYSKKLYYADAHKIEYETTDINLKHPDLLTFYETHIHSLGLIDIISNIMSTTEEVHFITAHPNPQLIYTETFIKRQLNNFGKTFAQACLETSDSNDDEWTW